MGPKAKPRQKEINENSKWGKEIIVTKSINPKDKIPSTQVSEIEIETEVFAVEFFDSWN
jgi:hypothetical protein